MVFPIVLVGAFFVTLNLNHKVLYSPSDFTDEVNFIRLVKATPTESQKKREEEIQDIDVSSSDICEVQESGDAVVTPFAVKNRVLQREQKTLISKVKKVEKAAVKKISNELGLDFTQDCIIGVPRAEVLYDAVGSRGREMFALEVKFFKSDNVTLSKFNKLLEQSEIISNYYKSDGVGSLYLKIHIVIEDENANLERVQDRMKRYLEGYSVPVGIDVEKMSDLLSAY